MFLIKTIDENYRMNTSESFELGWISFAWRNYFGDPGLFKMGAFKTQSELLPVKDPSGKLIQPAPVAKKEIEVHLLHKDKVTLELEKPQKVMFRLHNKTQRQMKLEIGIQ